MIILSQWRIVMASYDRIVNLTETNNWLFVGFFFHLHISSCFARPFTARLLDHIGSPQYSEDLGTLWSPCPWAVSNSYCSDRPPLDDEYDLKWTLFVSFHHQRFSRQYHRVHLSRLEISQHIHIPHPWPWPVPVCLPAWLSLERLDQLISGRRRVFMLWNKNETFISCTWFDI